MGRVILGSRKQASQVLYELEQRFMNHERLSVNDILKEYFIKEGSEREMSLESLRYYSRRVRTWLYQMKGKLFKNHGLYFGTLNHLGQYGLPLDEEEYHYIQTKSYLKAKNQIFWAQVIFKEAQDRGHLLESVSKANIQVPQITG